MSGTRSHNRSNFGPILIIGALFFIFGFVTWLNAALIPYLRLACELTQVQAYWVTFAFYISYFVMALPASAILARTGFKNGMSWGLLVMALGALIFVPAAMSRTYGLFLLGLFVQGTGLALLQTASNPYITILGPIERAAQRISIMGICNKTAGILSPLLLGMVVLKDADAIGGSLPGMEAVQKASLLGEVAGRVILPYVLMSLVLTGLALLARYSSLPEVQEENDNTQGDTARSSILHYPHLLLGALAIFLYVGAEVIAADTIIPYGKFWGIPMEQARFFSSFTLGGMLLGYVLGILLIPRLLSQEQALRISAILGVLFTAAAMLTQGFVSVLCISALGLANALVWPAVWPLAIDGLGRFTKTGSALLIMGIAGGAILPLVYGAAAEAAGGKMAYALLIPCYLFILYYAVKGHKLGRA